VEAHELVAASADPHLVDGILQLPGAFGDLDLDDATASPSGATSQASGATDTWEVVVGSEVGWSWVTEVTRAEDGTWRVVEVAAIGGGR